MILLKQQKSYRIFSTLFMTFSTPVYFHTLLLCQSRTFTILRANAMGLYLMTLEMNYRFASFRITANILLTLFNLRTNPVCTTSFALLVFFFSTNASFLSTFYCGTREGLKNFDSFKTDHRESREMFYY